MAERLDPGPGEILLDPGPRHGRLPHVAIRHMRQHYVKIVHQEEKMQVTS